MLIIADGRSEILRGLKEIEGILKENVLFLVLQNLGGREQMPLGSAGPVNRRENHQNCFRSVI